MKTILKGCFFAFVLILFASCPTHAQSKWFIQIDRIDSTEIVLKSDTLNRQDSIGRRTGLWIYWSTNEVAFTQKLEHLESDSGRSAYSHIYDTLVSETVLFPKIRSIGMYSHGNRIGQWLGFTVEGSLDWSLYFDSFGKFSLLNKFSGNGELLLSGSPSLQSKDMVHLSWYNSAGNVVRTEEVPISYLP